MQKRKLMAMGLCLALMGNVVAGDNSATDKKTEATQQAAVQQGLFVNLTTDDTWAAAKAILFAHQKALKSGKKPVAIQDMLTAFMKDGGIVIACGACSKAAGLTKDDFIDGVQMGNQQLVSDILFNPNVKTLSW